MTGLSVGKVVDCADVCCALCCVFVSSTTTAIAVGFDEHVSARLDQLAPFGETAHQRGVRRQRFGNQQQVQAQH